MCRSAHAEANAIALAAKIGVSLEGATIYCTLEPCITCAKLIVMSGISKIIYEYGYESPVAKRDNYWKKVLSLSQVKLEEKKLTENIIKYAVEFLQPDTSRRRIQ